MAIIPLKRAQTQRKIWTVKSIFVVCSRFAGCTYDSPATRDSKIHILSVSVTVKITLSMLVARYPILSKRNENKTNQGKNEKSPH